MSARLNDWTGFILGDGVYINGIFREEYSTGRVDLRDYAEFKEICGYFSYEDFLNNDDSDDND